MKPFSIFPALCIAVFGLHCSEISAPEEAEELVYYTSFEIDADTVGWQGYAFGFKKEAPVRGGHRSLAVSGGCIYPHALLVLAPPENDSRLVLRCWGKNIGIGGGVTLELGGDQSGSIHISVQDTGWKAYESADTLFCPKGNTLNLSLGAGGIAWSAMLVDLIEIKRIH